ncbi:MAG: hypothetical protein HQL39_12535 [Alphaproteobacteria bacterium]|nr:hypothetical protein [Alphaproteobacteria bacterium]
MTDITPSARLGIAVTVHLFLNSARLIRFGALSHESALKRHISHGKIKIHETVSSRPKFRESEHFSWRENWRVNFQGL